VCGEGEEGTKWKGWEQVAEEGALIEMRTEMEENHKCVRECLPESRMRW
jgi:hypothetical protein